MTGKYEQSKCVRYWHWLCVNSSPFNPPPSVRCSPPSDPAGAPSAVALCVVPCSTEWRSLSLQILPAGGFVWKWLWFFILLSEEKLQRTQMTRGENFGLARVLSFCLESECMSLESVKGLYGSPLQTDYKSLWDWVTEKTEMMSVTCGGCFQSFLGYLVLWPLQTWL